MLIQGEIMKNKKIVTLLMLSSLGLAACSSGDDADTDTAQEPEQEEVEEQEEAEEETPVEVTVADGSVEGAEVPAEGTVYARQMYTAPHGTKSFATVTVLMNGETIISADLDEFQYLDPADFDGVPNSDAGFGEAYPEGTVLASKAENDEAYSTMMTENAGATQTWQESVDAITDFAAGKTAAELEEALTDLEAQGEDDDPADVVSGATFVDTYGYLKAIVDTAQNGMVSVGVETDTTDLVTNQTLSAPHGDKSFAVTTVAMDGDTIAAVFLDEFQYTDPTDFGGVPNSDDEFGEGIADGQVLASKLANDEAYSTMMTEHAGATQTYADNMQAIIDFALGKTVAELEEAVADLDGLGEDDSPADVVSGATFADTSGYLQSIIDAAN